MHPSQNSRCVSTLPINTELPQKKEINEYIQDESNKMNHISLKRDNSIKSFSNRDSHSKNSNNEPLKIRDLETSNTVVTPEYRQLTKCEHPAKSVKVDSAMTFNHTPTGTQGWDDSSIPTGARCASPDVMSCMNPPDQYFYIPDDIHASPKTKEIILKHAETTSKIITQQNQNIQALQQQIIDLHNIV